jgi:flagellar biosynthesis protein FliQ
MSFEIPAEIKFWLNFIHPILMWVLLGVTIYALYLGLQVRRTRTAEGELKKELIKGRYNVRHYQIGSVLLALMVIGALAAMAVTYINNQKLFFGPHLLIGLSMTAMIAVSASLSHFMQKGKKWARYTHIILNAALLALFSWQAVSGVQIIQNILSKS